MTIYSFVGDEYLKNIFHLSAEEAVKHPDYNKYIRVLSKAIKDEEISLATVEAANDNQDKKVLVRKAGWY